MDEVVPGGAVLSEDAVPADDVVLSDWGHAPHAHDEHLFVYAPMGTITMTAHEREHVVNSATGLWVPAGVVHGARFSRDALVLSEEFEVDGHPLPYRHATAVEVTSDARDQLFARSRIGYGEPPSPELFAVLAGLRAGRLPLIEPHTPIARAVARELTGSPGDRRTAAEWAAEHFTSSTSLRRAFRAETGLSFTEWRTRLRLNHSLDLLAKGLLVGAVAARVGFASANGYILAFRRHFGETPGAYTARRGPGGPSDGGPDDGRPQDS